ncbi:MAG: efflux transporter outer membrane subunit [Leptothrix sp. (in: b-proteobacteria)]
MASLQKSRRARATLLPLIGALLLAGCANLAPSYQRPAAPIPAELPAAASIAASAPAGQSAAPLAWTDFIQSAPLRQLVQQALANNRDLRVAMLNVERARAQAGVVAADRYPTIGAGLTAGRAPSITNGKETNSFTAGLQVSSWEADFFGRIANLNDAAKAQLLATEAGRRSAELALVGAVASSYLSLAADAELLAVAERTLASREGSFKLTQLKADAGAASQLELQSALSLVAQARTTQVQLSRQRSQDQNALALLLGGPVPAELLPVAAPQTAAAPSAAASAAGPELAADPGWLADVPVGLSSDVLLRRPDVVQAEQQLIGANANIGAARAAFFPRITLTASAGQAASVLGDLLSPGHFAWTLSSQALLTIFDSGRNQANLDAAKLSRDIAVAQYEKAVQSAFRDTADALAGLATWRDQLAAQQQLLVAARDINRLTELRYQHGAASELDRQDAQRNLFAAEQAVVQTRLAEQVNRVALWKALGG